MKFTDDATTNKEIIESLDSAEWIEAMIKLDKSNMSQDQLIALEMSLAREGSMLAVEEAKIEKIRIEERQKIKKQLDFESKEIESEIQKLEEEILGVKQLTKRKLEEIKQLANQRLEKSAKQLFLLKTLSNQQIATILDLPIKKIQQLKKDFDNNQKELNH